MRLDSTHLIISRTFRPGEKAKSKRISADRAHTIVMEDIAAEDWHEQPVGTVARDKAFSGCSKDQRDDLTKVAEAPSGLPKPHQVIIQMRYLRISKRQSLREHGI
jgi:hypothetical protein